MATDFDKLWADALSAFFATTDTKLDDKLLPSMSSVDDLKFELSKRHESFLEFRKKKHDLVCHKERPEEHFCSCSAPQRFSC